jgi:hypothetical protein
MNAHGINLLKTFSDASYLADTIFGNVRSESWRTLNAFLVCAPHLRT